MGGACRLVTSDKVIYGPQSTNNFQIKKFVYRGYTFYSCEHAYQTFKFNEGSTGFNVVLNIKPEDDSEKASSNHGNEVWWHGQKYNSDRNKDWEKIKIISMLDINRAKYAQHPDQCAALLSTGTLTIVGGASTTWNYKGTEHNWGYWNGRIQSIIREELRLEPARNMDLLNSLLSEIKVYENL